MKQENTYPNLLVLIKRTLLILLLVLMTPNWLNAQSNSQITSQGFKCLFTNMLNSNGKVFPCFSKVRAEITYTSNISLNHIDVVFPNSFEIESINGSLNVTPSSNFSPSQLDSSYIENTTVNAGNLLNQRFYITGNSTGSLTIEFTYKACNTYFPASTTNNSFLYFDCDGGTSNTINNYAAIISQNGLISISNNQLIKAINSTVNPPLLNIKVSNLPAIATSTFTGVAGTQFLRQWKISKNTTQTTFITYPEFNSFILNIPKENDVDANDTIIVVNQAVTPEDTTYFTPAYYTSNTAHYLLSNNDQVVALKISQKCTLSCSNLVDNGIDITASYNCSSCSANIISNQKHFNGVVLNTPNLEFDKASLHNTSSNDTSSACDGNCKVSA